MPLILGANSASGGYNVANSLRFNSGSSDNLSRTPATATNRKTWTWSAWVKKVSNPATFTSLLEVGTGSNVYTTIAFDTSEKLVLATQDEGSGGVMNVISSAVLRDTSAWYHIVIAIDTTQATASNRVKGWINGQQITSFSTADYPTQNRDTYVNNTNVHYIGRRFGGTYFNGYMSEIYLIDGQALTPSSFGQTDPSVPSSGIWQPKAYTGSFGTNGFYLKFANSAALGTDSSGNGNTFTVNNLTSVDQSTDTPTNNFATMNALDNYYFGATFSEGNLKVVTNASNESYGTPTFGLNAGKWYWEVKVTSSQNYEFIGIVDIVATSSSFTAYTNATNAISYYAQTGGYVLAGGAANPYGNSYTTNDIIGVALDITNGKLYFSKNGTFQNSGVPTSGATGTGAISISSSPTNGAWFPQVGEIYTGSSTMELNFGSPSFTIASGNADAEGFGNFEYAVPSGYFAICTKNLADYG